jgi:hypothetical protein
MKAIKAKTKIIYFIIILLIFDLGIKCTIIIRL